MSTIVPALAPQADVADPIPRALAAAIADAPYLARRLAQAPELAERLAAEGPATLIEAAIAEAEAAAAFDFTNGMAALRIAKARAHVACAIGELSGALNVMEAAAAFSRFADACLNAAARLAANALIDTAQLRASEEGSASGPIPGLLMLAMGKHGAFELNYSSDIDVTLFFDPARLPCAPGREAQPTAIRAAQLVVKALEEATAEGYVLRTDLRLRPDPGATPPVVSVAAAERYYESLGQNWERAAFIKARAAAGDIPAGTAFLEDLQSFVWRRNLDFAAIDDIRAIKRQILASNDRARLDDPAFDVKLGRGGIRDIEFFAQTQQLILGGRNPALRTPQTLAALSALAGAAVISAAEAQRLSAAYRFFRAVEHRIQMRHDEQTHRLPADADARLAVARLSGFADLAAFDEAVRAERLAVIGIDERLFAPAESLGHAYGRLVFTGVDDDPETLETLSRLGFADPARVGATLRAWHHGRVRATRSARAREILTAITPALLEALADVGAPDLALARFDAFLAGLPAGVQLLSMFQERPALLGTLAQVCALSESMAKTLAQKPATLDAMIDPAFDRPLDHDAPGARLAAALAVSGGDFEAALNGLRRFAREERFRIDLHTLTGRADPIAAGAAHADLAQACVTGIAGACEAEIARRFGPLPGVYTVLALGKFGGRELGHGSDLDLMLVYEADAGGEAFARFLQRFVTGLSAPTQEGALYPVDLQLRPSGSKGPAAVRFASFARYYREEAWTWELLALTRLRAVAGDPALGERVRQEAEAALRAPRDPHAILADAAAMRGRMEKERPARGPWDLKLAPGGLVDVEFIAQTLQLIAAPGGADVLRPNTAQALAALRGANALAAADAQSLLNAWRLYSTASALIRIAAEGAFDPETVGAPLRARLTDAMGAHDFAAAEALLKDAQAQTRAIFLRLIGDPGDGTAPLTR